MTFDGLYYDFQVAGEVVMAKSADDFEVQARFDERGGYAFEAKAREHAERVEAAIAAVKQLDNGRRDSKPRASTTDPGSNGPRASDRSRSLPRTRCCTGGRTS